MFVIADRRAWVGSCDNHDVRRAYLRETDKQPFANQLSIDTDMYWGRNHMELSGVEGR
jgi:hypothetical protein